MGTPEFAVPILKSLFNSKHKILEVYTQPPKKKNRGQKFQKSPIQDFSEKKNIKIRHPDIFDIDNINHIKKLSPDIVIVVAYGKILPASLLNLDKILFLNIHASLLPKWRGAAPIQRAIMNMDTETGLSIMKIVPELDAGPVMLKKKLKIKNEMNYQELADQLSRLGSKLIIEALQLIEENKANFKEQNIKEVSYAQKIQKTETKINWNVPANKLIAKINAFSPSPGSWFDLDNARIKITKAKEVVIKGEPGKIMDEKFTVACSKNAIQILELKKEGKQKMLVEEFLRGNKIKIGKKLN